MTNPHGVTITDHDDDHTAHPDHHHGHEWGDRPWH